MSETESTLDPIYYTGNRQNYYKLLDHFNAAMELEGVSDDARVIALAIRVGLAEQAVELSSMRGFGVGQATRSAT
jgi:hypothetical protein